MSSKIKSSLSERIKVAEYLKQHLRRSNNDPHTWEYEDGLNDKSVGRRLNVPWQLVTSTRLAEFGKIHRAKPEGSADYIPLQQFMRNVTQRLDRIEAEIAVVRTRLEPAGSYGVTNGSNGSNGQYVGVANPRDTAM